MAPAEGRSRQRPRAGQLLVEQLPSSATQAVIEITTDFDCSLLNDVTIALADKEGNLTTVASTDQCSNQSVG